jgi:hypothetical protein
MGVSPRIENLSPIPPASPSPDAAIPTIENDDADYDVMAEDNQRPGNRLLRLQPRASHESPGPGLRTGAKSRSPNPSASQPRLR